MLVSFPGCLALCYLDHIHGLWTTMMLQVVSTVYLWHHRSCSTIHSLSHYFLTENPGIM